MRVAPVAQSCAGLHPNPPPIRREDQISSLNRQATLVVAGAMQQKRRSASSEPRQLSLHGGDRMHLKLALERGVLATSPMPPHRAQTDRDTAGIYQLGRPTGDADPRLDAQPRGQVLARPRAALDLSGVPRHRPVRIGVDEGAHSRRVGDPGSGAPDPFEESFAAELGDGVLDDSAADAVLGLELSMRGDAVSGRPVAGLDELSEAGGEPLVRRTHASPQRTIL